MRAFVSMGFRYLRRNFGDAVAQAPGQKKQFRIEGEVEYSLPRKNLLCGFTPESLQSCLRVTIRQIEDDSG